VQRTGPGDTASTSGVSGVKEIIIEHVSGEKANQRESFPIDKYPSISIGRELHFEVKFGDASDEVSRKHARLEVRRVRDSEADVVIHDLASRNGVFVNGQKIISGAPLNHLDKIRLGAGGPEFLVRFNPEPVRQPKGTREVQLPGVTREHTTLESSPPTRVTEPVPDAPAQSARQGVGRDTVERLIAQQTQSAKRSSAVIWLASIAGLVLLFGAGAFYFNDRVVRLKAEQDEQASKPLVNSDEGWESRIYEQYADSVVYIEATWRVVDSESNQPVYHFFGPYRENGKLVVGASGRPLVFPHYISRDGKNLQPLLTTTAGEYNQPIGGSHRGSGFVVREDGFIVTNKHVGAAWKIPSPDILKCPCVIHVPTLAGEVAKLYAQVTPEMVDMIRHWVPASEGSGTSQFVGENVKLNVIFNNASTRNKATLSQVSDVHDVAMLKVEVAKALIPIPLAGPDSELKVGEHILAMGYPGTSAQDVVVRNNQGVLNDTQPDVSVSVVPAVSQMPGSITVIHDAARKNMYSSMRDAFALSVRAGPGTSGGAVFNKEGKAFGVYFAVNTDFSYAVPIKYARELMGTEKL